ncbi:MAG: Gx transporter family protein [Oscillospiraceae bacterium]|nr:Gx transporter family protein [Oscillospiraceae bacterium]
MTNTKKLALMAILTAVALIIFIVEAQIPLPVPVPGVKLGLANAVTLFALFFGVRKQSASSEPHIHFAKSANKTDEPSPCLANKTDEPSLCLVPYLTTANVFTILICRIILGAVFSGRPAAFVFSITGGVLALTAQVIMKRFVTSRQIWVCGAVGAVFHNIGQIIAAILITGTPAIAAYLPVLIVVGVFTGVLTGLIAQFTLERLRNTRL